MSAQRVLAPLTSSVTVVFKFAATPTTASLRPCQHVLRTFSSAQSTQTSSKRKMQTSTAYQPYTFDAPPPPPRNTGVLDTSIVGSMPHVDETRPFQGLDQYNRSSTAPVEQEQHIGLPEKEAQKSRITATPTPTPTPTPQPSARPARKLRARKAAMSLTPDAVKQLKTLLDQPRPKLIKVGVRNKGCSGLTYHLDYVEKPDVLDEAVEQDGVKVLIDSKALFSIIGSEMDWVEDKLSQRFVFTNPNIKEQCGCGESFMV
ncbi:Fe-S cluster assembly protein SufA [Amylocarpus encephaloides]|uniref:Iron-sulfur assembly protein 1 n=1 Tax=Amylocarpus encephaloides TaxID=45428 RepID=A0A9P7Y9N2_9HELO|nr:Fe-S cluster assembly protein SufA [Amylocarpus encephaloides]